MTVVQECIVLSSSTLIHESCVAFYNEKDRHINTLFIVVGGRVSSAKMLDIAPSDYMTIVKIP